MNTIQSIIDNKKENIQNDQISDAYQPLNKITIFFIWLHNNALKLYIAGDGPEKNEIERIIKEKDLQNNIKLLGFLKQEEVKKYISEASFVVIPSIWYENCPYSILETQAIGKPVIGANIAGIPELVKDKENGLIYDYDNVDELEKSMKLLFENEKLANEYGENAKKYAKNNYDKEIYYKKINNIYEKIVNKNK